MREFGPFTLAAMRLLLLAFILLPFIKRPPREQWTRLAGVALFNGVLHFGFNFAAVNLSRTLASPAIVLQSYVPMAALLSWLLRGERFDARTGGAIFVAFAGVLVLGLDPAVLASPVALAMMIAAAFFLATGTVIMRGLAGVDVWSQQGITSLLATIPLCAIAFAFETPIEAATHATWVGWFGVAYAALGASLLGHGLFFVLVRKHPIARIAPYLLLTPIFATVFGVVFLGDQLGHRVVLGGAMVLAGVWLMAVRSRTN